MLSVRHDGIHHPKCRLEVDPVGFFIVMGYLSAIVLEFSGARVRQRRVGEGMIDECIF